VTLTPEQRAALDALPPKRRAFVLAYVGEARGVAVEAARIAGYAEPHPEGVRLLRIATVAAAVKALQQPAEDAKVASLLEQRVFWSAVQRGEFNGGENPKAMRDRLKASELLGKSTGAFVAEQPTQHVTQVLLIVAPSDLDAAKFMRGGKGE
jgi:hypothetical protein